MRELNEIELDMVAAGTESAGAESAGGGIGYAVGYAYGSAVRLTADFLCWASGNC